MGVEEKRRERYFKIDFMVRDEAATRDVFAMFHKDLGYRIIKSSREFPDYILEDESGRRIRAEVEFKASRFNHPIEECDMIICWHNDWPDCPIEVLELCRFVEEPISFSREELKELANILASIIDRLKGVIRYVDEFIRRSDHQIKTSLDEESLRLLCERKNWQTKRVIALTIDLLRGSIKIIGGPDLDMLSSYSREELQQIINEAESEGFIVGDAERQGPLGIGELMLRVGERKSVDIFRLHDLVEIAGKSPKEIAEMLGSEVLKLVDFMEDKRLVRVVSEEQVMNG